jgi:hypothetical protein
MPFDFKKEQKELYQPKTTPSIIDVPSMKFIVVNGNGDPNCDDFSVAVETLYSLSYAIKMGNKSVFEYVVPPLEGIWWTGCDIADKEKFEWAIMLRQPDFVTEEVFETAKAALKTKKKHLDFTSARLEQFTEGLCAQVMHIGPYDDEPKTIDALEKFVEESGYVLDITDDSVKALSRRHHEVYLSDPRKTARDKLKTVIRYPIKKM